MVEADELTAVVGSLESNSFKFTQNSPYPSFLAGYVVFLEPKSTQPRSSIIEVSTTPVEFRVANVNPSQFDFRTRLAFMKFPPIQFPFAAFQIAQWCYHNTESFANH